jgi:gas vesicle protein
MTSSTAASEAFAADSSTEEKGDIPKESASAFEQLEKDLDEALKCLAWSGQYRKEEAERHAAVMETLEEENDDLVDDIQEAVEVLQGMGEHLLSCEGKYEKLVVERDAISEKFHGIRQGLMIEEEVKDAIGLANAEEISKTNILIKEQQRTCAIMKLLQAENDQMQQEIERLCKGRPLAEREKEDIPAVSANPWNKVKASHLVPDAPLSTRDAAQVTKEWINSAVDYFVPKETTARRVLLEKRAARRSMSCIVDFPSDGALRRDHSCHSMATKEMDIVYIDIGTL